MVVLGVSRRRNRWPAAGAKGTFYFLKEQVRNYVQGTSTVCGCGLLGQPSRCIPKLREGLYQAGMDRSCKPETDAVGQRRHCEVLVRLSALEDMLH